MTPLLAIAQIILQVISILVIAIFLWAQLQLQRHLLKKLRIKDTALVQAISLLRQIRASIIFTGPPDDDPLRQAIETLEKAALK